MTSSHSFQDVLRKIELAVGHPNMSTFRADVASVTTYADLAKVVEPEVGPPGLMELTRFDLGEILRKHHGPQAPHVVRLDIGNPLIMLLAGYNNERALPVAHDLDGKVESLLARAAMEA